MKYLQMAAGDRFSRIGSYAGTLFLSAVNVRISSPSDPRHLHTGIAICTVHYSSHGVSVPQPGKPRKGTKHSCLLSCWEKWGLRLQLFVASLVSVLSLVSYRLERGYPP